MIYIINATESTYDNLLDYLNTLEVDDSGTVIQLLFLYQVEDLFTKIKQRTALRAKYAKDDKGESLLEKFALTDDEREITMGWMRTESAKVFRRISAYSKDINSAFRFDVNFGDPLISSVVEEVASTLVTDTSLEMTINAYAGMKMIITSPGIYENDERTIVSNDEDSFTLNEAFDGDITDMEYIVVPVSNKYILIYSQQRALYYDTNTLEGVDALIEKCIIEAVIKEWYLLNRYMDDWKIESEILANDMLDLVKHFSQTKKPYRRATDMFS